MHTCDNISVTSSHCELVNTMNTYIVELFIQFSRFSFLCEFEKLVS